MSLLKVDISQIIVHEAYEPNALVDFLDSQLLTGEYGRDVDFLAMHAAAGCDEDVAGALMAAVLLRMARLTEAVMATDDEKRVETTGDKASGRDPNASSLIAMLIAGLILVTVGAIIVMTFV